MNGRRHRIKAAAGVAALGILAGCAASGTTQAAPATPAATAAHPANPVTVLRETGATPDPGEVYGHAGAENDQVAHGTFSGGEEVWVFTYDSAGHRSYWIAHPVSGPQDGETDILGPDVSLIIVDAASLTAAGGPAPAQIAARVHGTVLAAQALG